MTANTQNNTPASRNEEAVKTALLPFAKLGGPWDSFGFKAFPDLEDEIVIFENSGAFITAADVRNARKALAASRTEQAVPSVASGVASDDLMLIRSVLRGYPSSFARADALAAVERLAAPGAAIAAREQKESQAEMLDQIVTRFKAMSPEQQEHELKAAGESELGRLLEPLFALRQEAPAASAQGTVSVDLYLKLADAMGYDSGKDGMEFSPEEWAAALLKDALAHRAASSEALPPATVAQPVDMTPEELFNLAGQHAYSVMVLNLTGYVLFDLPRLVTFVSALRAQPCASQGYGGAVSDMLHTFMNAAAGEGYVLDGVDAADLYIALFPERYAAAIAKIDTGASLSTTTKSGRAD